MFQDALVEAKERAVDADILETIAPELEKQRDASDGLPDFDIDLEAYAAEEYLALAEAAMRGSS